MYQVLSLEVCTQFLIFFVCLSYGGIVSLADAPLACHAIFPSQPAERASARAANGAGTVRIACPK